MSGAVRCDEGDEASQQNDEVLRIVLVGKTGAGKSATGNTILGSDAFTADISFQAVTQICSFEASRTRNVSVVDTPGLFDNKVSEDKTIKEIGKCIRLAAPGPHAILLVISIDRFTPEQQRSVEIIQTVFGKTSNEYTIILFTNGDQLKKPVKEKLRACPKLQKIVDTCYGYHVFNNKTTDPSQVDKLLEKINQMVLKNGGGHYTNEMFEEAAREIEEEKRRREKRLKEELSKKKRREDLQTLGACTGASTLVGATIGAVVGTGAAVMESAVATAAVVALESAVTAGGAALVALDLSAAAATVSQLATVGSAAGPVGAVVGLVIGLGIAGICIYRGRSRD